MDKQEYLSNMIKPIMESMIYQLVTERPDNPTLYILDWLQKTGGYTSGGLSLEEKKELDDLKKQIQVYREKEGFKDEVESEDDSDEEEKLNDLETLSRTTR